MSGFGGLLRHASKSKSGGSDNSAENVYFNVLKRQLPPENQINFDAELKLLLMDGFVHLMIL